MTRRAVLMTFCLFLAAGANAARGQAPMTVAKGTRAYTIRLPLGQKIPADLLPGAEVDLTAEVRDPVETAVVLRKVKLLAVDLQKGNESLTVQLTPIQVKVLTVLQADGIHLDIKKTDGKQKPAKK